MMTGSYKTEHKQTDFLNNTKPKETAFLYRITQDVFKTRANSLQQNASRNIFMVDV